LGVSDVGHSISGMNPNPPNSESKAEWAHANFLGVEKNKGFYLCMNLFIYF
jgi:hypothetical protein